MEAFLREKYNEKYEFYSAGLSPIDKPNMDPRSINYLEENGIKKIIHNPKKITKKMLNYFDYFIAVDSFILSELNKIYPRYKHKFVLATSNIENINLVDPYHMDDDNYRAIIEKLNTLQI